LRSLTTQSQVSNIQAENLMVDISAVKKLLKQYENCLIGELKTSDELAEKIRLELLIDDAVKAQMGVADE